MCTALPLPVSTTPVVTCRKRSIASLSSREKPTKCRKSRRIYDFTFDFLAQFFHMPQRQAADALHVSVITIKRNCKRHGFRWPYRANKYRSGHSFVLSEKGRAFHDLPLDCLRDDLPLDQPTWTASAHEDLSSSECDTDTESLHEDEQAKNDCGEILASLHKLSSDVDAK
ncbi:unnamed protein product [Hyaloperonospora brassicae]|uniref:RWP-RK domain-containing protein n=1 Tax=Hyaloperonospora brassicae TaxID=162125 RepID=A0AAV0V594_HYABA|nr:unnamed protein product [Hyaloperonospora brassicae]